MDIMRINIDIETTAIARKKVDRFIVPQAFQLLPGV